MGVARSGAASVSAVLSSPRKVRPMSRGPLVRWFAPLVIGAAAVAGCSVPSNAPDGYDDQVQANFVTGCTGAVPETDGTTTTLASTSSCECAYDVFVEQVPYDDAAREDEAYAGYPAEAPTFRKLDDEAGGDAEASNELPQDVRDALGACKGEDVGPLSPTTTGAATTDDTGSDGNDGGDSDGGSATSDTATGGA